MIYTIQLSRDHLLNNTYQNRSTTYTERYSNTASCALVLSSLKTELAKSAIVLGVTAICPLRTSEMKLLVAEVISS